MSLSDLSVTRGLGRLAPSLRDKYRGPVRRREGGLPGREPEPKPCAPSPTARLGCWIVRATLALYLLPALLIVLLVGAVGSLALDVARLCDRWTEPTAE